ncbi:hypothetical protein A2U01_0000427, partial [Trifolium medium]|nr:hypothetical protein [Trifolium medium]
MKMKSCSYLFQLFLFLLLITVNTTVSAGLFPRRFPTTGVKNIGKVFKSASNKWDKTLDKINNIVNDLSPSQQGIEIQGLY